MKLAMPVNEKNIKSGICCSFGRAPWFMIYDTEIKKESFIDNSAASSAGGAGIKAAQLLVDQNIDGLITPRCGQNAAEVVQGADIQIIESQGEDIEENIKLFEKGKLVLLSEIHAGYHNHGK
ncbi:NifB/NifX family molybdenum-iron cluster-binding protein [Alkalibacter saccharofermentans]|uniref:Predicted Fe-Mo cluster-binding protein, NifX family n=1 Tax=Alkalibacter saccharofermentans DSM 14828 TaxID=1120975 RepID=A0A1M4WK22_9FIRM|nr:NifB/NifX family molybdenum-iron cluster-binding protein [Alkalibacter saccharofermentans]SHE81545.1 Predicted Fe-Mo cluster-binding protein, NifX family [Alkalibacter saccharofermentans DSM 14828]